MVGGLDLSSDYLCGADVEPNFSLESGSFSCSVQPTSNVAVIIANESISPIEESKGKDNKTGQKDEGNMFYILCAQLLILQQMCDFKQ